MTNRLPSDDAARALENILRVVDQVNRALTCNMGTIIEAHQQRLRDLARNMDAMMQAHLQTQCRIESVVPQAIKAQQEMQRRIESIAPHVVAAHQEMQRRIESISPQIAKQLEQVRKMAEQVLVTVQRDAADRGMTVNEYMTALATSEGVVTDPQRLRKLQAVHAWNLYALGEISFLRLFQGLPPEHRPMPFERTGVPDDDFKPLFTGITRKREDA